MKLVVGLGNPGKNHEKNRHNVGILVVDKLKAMDFPGFVFVKSSSFMNSSGSEILKFVKKYNTPLDDLFIVHDDLDIALGEYKIQKGKGPKGHNGIISIEEALSTPDFWRVRIGVENRSKESKEEGEKYVLSDFSEEEREVVNKAVGRIARDLKKL